MSQRHRRIEQRRIRAATVRVEQQPYDFTGGIRAPRSMPVVNYGYCQPLGGMSAATGTWPDITPAIKTNTAIYAPGWNTNTNAAELVEVVNSTTVYNWHPIAWGVGHTMAVRANNLGGFDALDEENQSGMRLSPGACGCICDASFTVFCGASVQIGATVTVKSGSTTIASGTTDGSGNVTLDIGSEGTYTVTVTGVSCLTNSITLDLTCGSSTTIQCCPSCDTCALGTFPAIYVTDSQQTTACVFSGSGWIGCYQATASPVLDICGCQSGSGPGVTTTPVVYFITCNLPRQLLIQRKWYACPGTCTYCYGTLDSSCLINEVDCGSGPSGCPSTGGGTDQVAYNFQNCDPFPLSLSMSLGNLTCLSGAKIYSPLGAGIVLNS